MNDIVIYGRAKDELVTRLTEVRSLLLRRGFLATIYKVISFQEEISLAREVHTAAGMRHGPGHVQKLPALRRPWTTGELKHFLQAMNWMRTALPNLTAESEPLRVLQETCLKSIATTCGVAARRSIYRRK